MRLCVFLCVFAVALTALTLFFDASSLGGVIVGGVIFASLMTAFTWALSWVRTRQRV